MMSFIITTFNTQCSPYCLDIIADTYGFELVQMYYVQKKWLIMSVQRVIMEKESVVCI